MSCPCVCWVCISPNPAHASLCSYDCSLTRRDTIATPLPAASKIQALLSELTEDERVSVLRFVERLVRK